MKIILIIISIIFISSIITDARITSLSVPTYTLQRGDLNNDGNTDNEDARELYIIMQDNVGSIMENTTGFKKADMDDDGNLTFNDINIILTGGTFGNIRERRITTTQKGDINGDGIVWKDDLTYSIIKTRERITIGAVYECRMDANQDGQITKEDIEIITELIYHARRRAELIDC